MRPWIATLTNTERALLARYEVLYAEWKLADEAAAAAEAAVFVTLAAQRAGAAPAASAMQWDRALFMRAIAERALGHALEIVRSAPL